MKDSIISDPRHKISRHPSLDLFEFKKMKVMIIDDDLDFRLSLCEFLVSRGFFVTTARDAKTGISNLLKHQDLPDLITLDLLMPGMSGIQFRREQLRQERIKNIPVLFLSGQGYAEGETCLLKPFDENEFMEIVWRLITS